MEFGRLENIENIDFTLPSDHPGTLKVLGGVKTKNPKLYIGAPIWSDPGFPGKLYPAKAREKDYLKYYARQFNCIELNATHYRVPNEDGIIRWLLATGEQFKFCPKIHQSISHAKSLTQVVPLMKDLMLNLNWFKEKLGTSFMQLPPGFSTKGLDDLLTFLDLTMVKNMVIELRHESWYEKDHEAMKILCNYLYKNQLGLVITDVAGRRDVLHQRLTNKSAFIRFTANDLHPTDYERLKDWAERVSYWLDNGLEELYFFVHTPDKSLTPELAIYFIKELHRLTGLNIKTPQLLSLGGKSGKLF